MTGWIFIILMLIFGVFILVCIPHNLRVWRVRRQYKSLPNGIKKEVCQVIRAAAAKGPSVSFLCLDNELPNSEPQIVLQSHVGGIPYSEAGATWPLGGDGSNSSRDPARFLLQVRLDEPSLGQVWQGRLIEVFFGKLDLFVRSYANPSLQKHVPIYPATTPFDCIALSSLPMPIERRAEEGDDPLPISPKEMCVKIPEIPRLLEKFTRDHPGLLTQILRPGIYGYDLEEADIAYQGGYPMLIQVSHDAKCDLCHAPMRFLFQFGEIIPGFRVGDAGVIYIYGCDSHPDQCKGFFDSQ